MRVVLSVRKRIWFLLLMAMMIMGYGCHIYDDDGEYIY